MRRSHARDRGFVAVVTGGICGDGVFAMSLTGAWSATDNGLNQGKDEEFMAMSLL